MNKTEREELRDKIEQSEIRGFISYSLMHPQIVELLDALDEAEERLELYRRDSDAMQLSYIQKLDAAERKLAEFQDTFEESIEYVGRDSGGVMHVHAGGRCYSKTVPFGDGMP